MTTTFKMPEPFIYAHELIENKGGVWLGVAQKGLCEHAHTPGETGEEIVTLYTADALRDVLEQALNFYSPDDTVTDYQDKIRAMKEQIQ